MKNKLRLVILLAGLLLPLTLSAQTGTNTVIGVVAAEEGLELLTPDEIPNSGTFWLVANGTRSNLTAPLPCPPLGFDGYNIYLIADGSFLVDETTNDASTMSADAITNEATPILNLIDSVQTTALADAFRRAFGMDAPSPDDGGGGGGDYSPDGSGYALPDYGTNLWIAQDVVSNGWLNAIGSNTIADVEYQILSCTNLAQQTNWQSEGFIYGSEVTNWTPFSVAQNGRPILFIRLQSWQSSDGSGLPDWWEEEYFGTNGIDPFGNPAGDGYDNYYKFEHGMNPNVFYTPAAPQNINILCSVSNNTGTISWQPALGAVTGYTLIKTDSDPDYFYPPYVQTVNLSASTTSYIDNISGDPLDYRTGGNYDVTYQLRANYAAGNSAWGGPVPLQSPVISGNIVVSNGVNYLVVSGLPQNAATVILSGIDAWDSDLFGDLSYNYFYDIPATNFNSGMFPIPATWNLTNWTSDDSEIDKYVQSIDSSGDECAATSLVGSPGPEFHDGRRQLKDNLIFQLRAATTNQPLSVAEYDNIGPGPIFSQANSINYVCSSFYYPAYSYTTTFDENWPFEANYKFRNFVYDNGNPTSDGSLQTGLTSDGYGNDHLDDPLAYQFQPPSSPWTTNASLLGTNQTQWLAVLPPGFQNDGSYYSFGQALEQIGVLTAFDTNYNAFVSMQSGVRNIYGLPLSSTLSTSGNSSFSVITPGSGSVASKNYFYTDAAQPQLETVEYDFWPAYKFSPELPNSFAVTNQSQPLFVNVGGQIQVAGYAKMAVTNGYPGVYAYLGQYFATAYQVNTNGVVTTNTTGVLSPYGNFFATEAGRVALVTMPDVDTGQQGTNIVHCVSLQVDKNHDGVMDSTFNGADVTSQASPMVCWVNNGYTVAGTSGNLDQDLPLPPDHPEYANCLQGKVTCPRDLENFFRLWIRGVPQLPSAEGYTMTLSMTALGGNSGTNNPAINLYQSSDPHGGTGYLTDTNVAAEQARISLDGSGDPEYGIALATISAGQSYTLPANFFDLNYPYYSRFLFEGAGIGLGQLTLTISQNSNVLCQTSAYLDLHDVDDLYEEAVITNNMSGAISNWSSAIETVQPAKVSDPYSDSNIVVYIHGAANDVFSWLDRGDTVFKRLYWAGYYGKLAGVRWQSPEKNAAAVLAYGGEWFNTSELIGYKSASAFKDYLNELHSRLPSYRLNLLPQSAGGIMTSEAVKEGAPFDNLILLNTAVSASCYDVNAPTNAYLLAAETTISATPDWQPWGYHGAYTNLTGNIVNYFNIDDNFLALWNNDQIYTKARNTIFTYDGTNSYIYGVLITDPDESRAYVARSRSLAIGEQGPVTGQLNQGIIESAVDLRVNFNYGSSGDEHSAFYTRPIQSIWQLYDQILESYQIPTIQR